MAKKLRFALEMKNGVPVRNIEELRENFSLEKALQYISNGRMQTWLRDRYCHDIADSIEELDSGDPEYNKKLCDILGVEFDESQLEDIEKAKESDRKREWLKRFTDDPEILDNAYFAAFNQNDIYNLLNEGAKTIYLCGGMFPIPLDVYGVTYIGVNNPVAVINSAVLVDWNEKNITLEGVTFDNEYQSLIDSTAKVHSSVYGDYRESELGFMMSEQSKAESRQTYQKLAKQLEGVHYDIDRDIKELKDSLVRSGIAGLAKGYLERL